MTIMGHYSVVLADDHVLMRQGLKKIIEEMADLDVVGEAGHGLELLNLLNQVTPHLVILDISMPKLGGIEATSRIRMTHPEIKILILSLHKSREYFSHAMAAGADGYLLKEDADTELFSAIETIRQGGFYVSPLLQESLAGET